MLAILHLLVMLVADIFKSRRRLEAKNLFLRHQLNIAERRLVFGCTVLTGRLLDVSRVVKPETVL
jgi:hypothetical protein